MPSHRVDSTPAAAKIAGEIQRAGSITFARFMDIALYDPEVGYYSRPAADNRGPGPPHPYPLLLRGGEGASSHDSQLTTQDYVTSPELHPAFGALMCSQFYEMWRHLGEPSPFWLVEGGPGSGVFAADILTTAAQAYPRFAAALRLTLIERSPTLRARQATTLSPWADRVCWLEPLEEGLERAPLGPGCVFANELLDALPVHRAVMRGDGLRETYVTVAGDDLCEVEGRVSTPALEAQIATGGGRLSKGQQGEINLAAPHWVTAAAGLIDRGYMLLIDYGAAADALYGPEHPRGTLRCYWRQTMNEDPLSRVGCQDITAHVDFSAVARAALGQGLTFVGATRQAELLGRVGLPLLADAVESRVTGRIEQRAHRRALHQLVDLNGLGRVLALAFGKRAPETPLIGFARSTPAQPPTVPEMWQLRRPLP